VIPVLLTGVMIGVSLRGISGMQRFFESWAEKYTWRFTVLMVITVIIVAVVCGAYAWRQRGLRLAEQTGRKPRATAGGIAMGLLLLFFLFASFTLMSPFLLAQTAFLALLTVVSSKRRWLPARFSAIALVAVVTMICVAGGQGVIQAERVSREFPFESLVKRLEPVLATPTDPPELTQSGETALLQLENRFEKSSQRISRGYQRRRASLELVHASHVLKFVSSEGFGFGRMFGPTISNSRIAKANTYPQPVARLMGSPDLTGDRSDLWLPVSGLPTERLALNDLHENMFHDFANPNTYGWVRDLEHVAGFQSHAVRDFKQHTQRYEQKSPGGSAWKLERVELVSLLKSAEPGVYVSENLPRMDELADASRRALDGFETIALRELKGGESLVIRSQGERVKMMGALRAAKQCSLCHEVPRGTLLGAFSYCFRDQTSASASE